MIRIKDLKKVYSSKDGDISALNGVSLDIEDGRIFGIVGLSGAGKSTLIRCVNMLEKPTSGSIEIDGTDICSLPPDELRDARKKIGMIFQHFNLLGSRTALGNILFPLEIAKMPKAQAVKQAQSMLELVGLGDKANSYPSQLSGGQKQRVGIARALANNPSVLLSDEATSALDPQTTRSILDLVKEVNRRLGVTVILITHEMNVIKEICDEVAVIENGSIVELGPVTEVFTKPQRQITREFIQSVVNLDLPAPIKEMALKIPKGDEGRQTKILRLSFLGEAAGQPLISHLVRSYDVDVNILHGNIDRFKELPFGNLVVELVGTAASIDDALSWLAESNLGVEVLG